VAPQTEDVGPIEQRFVAGSDVGRDEFVYVYDVLEGIVFGGVDG
jgi:hypothetical protein